MQARTLTVGLFLGAICGGHLFLLILTRSGGASAPQHASFIEVQLQQLRGSCDQPSRLAIASQGIQCGVAPLDINLDDAIRSLKARQIWVLTEIETSQYRFGANLTNGKVWQFSYHSGSGKRELLLTKISVEQNNPTILRLGSELADPQNGTKIYSVTVIDPERAINDQLFRSRFRSTWARSHNPNLDWNVNQWISLVEDFSLSMTSENSTRWEAPYNLGINDRFATSDYACQADDVLLVVLNSGKFVGLYLGEMQWLREMVVDEEGRLDVKFSYRGPISRNRRSLDGDDHFKANKTAVLGGAATTRDEDLVINLTKAVSFRPDRQFAEWTFSASVMGGNVERFYWIVQDSPNMDFRERALSQILFEPTLTDGIIDPRDNEAAFLPGLYKTKGSKSMAIALSSANATARFVAPDYLSALLFREEITVSDAFSGSAVIKLTDSPGTFWVPGIVFEGAPSRAIEGTARFHFTSSFTDVSQVINQFAADADR